MQCDIFPLKRGEGKLHGDLEGSISHRSLFPAAVAFLLSRTYTAEHRPLLDTCCKQHARFLELVQQPTHVAAAWFRSPLDTN